MISQPSSQVQHILPILLIMALFATITLASPEDGITTITTDKPQQSILTKLGTFAWNIFCVVGPILQYYPTIKDVQSLSPYVIAILLISNIIRIFYWLADPFELPLVLQAVTMIAMQYILLQVLTNQLTQQSKSDKEKYPKITIWNSPLNLDTFWSWTDFQSYQIFLTTITTPFLGGFLLLNDYQWYGTFLGYLSLIIEAMLGLPQVYKNYKYGCVGLSPILFITWLIGDVAKTAAFFTTGAPLPFIACGILQTLTDIVIIGQIIIVNGLGAFTNKTTAPENVQKPDAKNE